MKQCQSIPTMRIIVNPIKVGLSFLCVKNSLIMFLERQFVKGKGSHFLKGIIFMTVGGHGGCLLRYKVTIMCMVALAW